MTKVNAAQLLSIADENNALNTGQDQYNADTVILKNYGEFSILFI